MHDCVLLEEHYSVYWEGPSKTEFYIFVYALLFPFSVTSIILLISFLCSFIPVIIYVFCNIDSIVIMLIM